MERRAQDPPLLDEDRLVRLVVMPFGGNCAAVLAGYRKSGFFAPEDAEPAIRSELARPLG